MLTKKECLNSGKQLETNCYCEDDGDAETDMEN